MRSTNGDYDRWVAGTDDTDLLQPFPDDKLIVEELTACLSEELSRIGPLP